MPQNRYYYYDHQSCSFEEVGPNRTKRVALGGAIFFASLVLAFGFAWLFDALLGTPQELSLQAENEALQQQLALVEERMDGFSAQLEELAQYDQRLYRTLLEAEPISEEVRRVGVGGADLYADYNRFGTATREMLRKTTRQLEQLERQVNLQNASYRELAKLAQDRSEWLVQMPAILPTDGPVVSGYGMRRHPILRVRKMHPGIDLLVVQGSPVYATGDGVVEKVGRNATYGKFVRLKHPATGYTTLYAHLSEIPKAIKTGRRVARGEQIALSGNTGRSSGPHLHYEVRDADDRTLNPIFFFAPSMTPQAYRTLLASSERTNVSLD